jgi:hypothetical protein
MRLRSLGSLLTRWTPFVVAWPRRYVSRDPLWRSFDFEAWSDRYAWTEDEWNGWLDVARRPDDTVDAETGDCEDYALVAVSWALARGRTPVGLGFCFPPRSPVPRHVVAYDRDRVYSSGEIREETIDEYLDRTEYAWAIRRRLA